MDFDPSPRKKISESEMRTFIWGSAVSAILLIGIFVFHLLSGYDLQNPVEMVSMFGEFLWALFSSILLIVLLSRRARRRKDRSRRAAEEWPPQ